METWPDSEVKRHALVGEGRPDPAPQVLWLNICPAPLGCLDTSTQPPSHHPSVLLRRNESWRGPFGRVPSAWPKVSPRCQRLQGFNHLERLGFAFLKALGQQLERGVYSEGSADWKNECCQMIFVLPVIWRKYPQNWTSSPRRRLWAAVPYSLPFSLLSNGSKFNCTKLRRPKAWWTERKCHASGEWCGKSTTSTLTLINAHLLRRAVNTHDSPRF